MLMIYIATAIISTTSPGSSIVNSARLVGYASETPTTRSYHAI
jgi:hypothetical protein